MRSSTTSAHTRAQIALDSLHPMAVVIDCFGHAWQLGGLSDPYWYRAYGDDASSSSYELAFKQPLRVLDQGVRRGEAS